MRTFQKLIKHQQIDVNFDRWNDRLRYVLEAKYTNQVLNCESVENPMQKSFFLQSQFKEVMWIIFMKRKKTVYHWNWWRDQPKRLTIDLYTNVWWNFTFKFQVTVDWKHKWTLWEKHDINKWEKCESTKLTVKDWINV